MVCEVGLGKEFLSRSLSISSMEQVVSVFCLWRRGRELGGGGFVLCLYLGLGE